MRQVCRRNIAAQAQPITRHEAPPVQRTGSPAGITARSAMRELRAASFDCINLPRQSHRRGGASAAAPPTHAYSVVAQTLCWPKPKALPVSTRPNHPFAGLRVCTATRTSTPGGEHQIGLPPRQSRVPRFLHKTAAEPRNRCRHFERAGAGALELALCANLVATVAARRHQVPCARSAVAT